MRDDLDVDAADAKKPLSRIFDLGLPTSDLPFLWSLASDVAQAAHLPMQMPANRHLQDMFGDRKHPRATRLFYAVSESEDQLLARVTDGIANIGWRPSALLFDELYFQCPAPPDIVEEAVGDACETFGHAFRVAQPQVTLASGCVCIALRPGTLGGTLERYPGSKQCMYDSPRYIGWDSPTATPSDGPACCSRVQRAADAQSRARVAGWLPSACGD
eukprot:8146519-Pyramimonas_sp.AAC.1